jgi:DNA polymerase-3 subunit epsilon
LNPRQAIRIEAALRQIVLDTETTGLSARLGDRIIEIACVEMVNRRLTGKHFHRYVNPGRAVEEGALKVHGITDEFLEYVGGAELIIHNAAFDVEFLNMELGKLKRDALDSCVAGVIDTLRQARELHPGKKNSLDALCERYAIDNAHRTLHGALLDAELLAEVYLAMTRGQESLAIGLETARETNTAGATPLRPRPTLIVLPASDEEVEAHLAVMAAITKESKGACVWDFEADAAMAAGVA